MSVLLTWLAHRLYALAHADLLHIELMLDVSLAACIWLRSAAIGMRARGHPHAERVGRISGYVPAALVMFALLLLWLRQQALPAP